MDVANRDFSMAINLKKISKSFFNIFKRKKNNQLKKNVISINKKYKFSCDYMDEDFEDCIKIFSKKLNHDEFNKASDLILNLWNGYSYGYNSLTWDVIKYDIKALQAREIKSRRKLANTKVKLIKFKGRHK